MAIKNQADIRKTLELVLVDNASSASLLHRSLVFVKVFSFQPIKLTGNLGIFLIYKKGFFIERVWWLLLRF